MAAAFLVAGCGGGSGASGSGSTVAVVELAAAPRPLDPAPPDRIGLVVPAGKPLRQGSRGPRVRALELALRGLGYRPGRADHVFTPATRAAVEAFQVRNGLPPDGRVGLRTLRELNRQLRRR